MHKNGTDRFSKFMGRGKTLIRYTACCVLFAASAVPAALLRRFHPRYQRLWLVGERGYDARDNGYWFYRYLCTAHPEIHACYVISDDSADREKVTSIGKTVRTGSFRHYLMYHAADVLIGTHVQPAAPDIWAFYRLAHGGIRAKGKQVFLQHGVITNNIDHLHYPALHIDLFVCGAKPEYDCVSAQYGHPEGVVRYLGLARYDGLYHAGDADRMILVMPTWRGAAYPQGDDFPQTAFYRYYQELLNAPELTELLEQQDLRLIFYPHTELQKELHHFSASSERIVLAGQEQYDVQTLLKRCALLVTDYSSVFWDVGYMNRPVIYYQFDEPEYRRLLYRESYFSYERDGFGPVVRSPEALLGAIRACADGGFVQPPACRERVGRCFPLRDDKNCERTFQAILTLEGGQKR